MHILKTETFAINSEQDVVLIRKVVRERVNALKFNIIKQTKLVTAASELTRNIIKYAKSGSMQLNHINNGHCEGLQLVFIDEGPGIADINRVMEGGYTTGGGLGLGLSGSKRLVDEFEITSVIGLGTCIKLISWK